MTPLDPDLERLGEALRASTAIDLAREEQAARPAVHRPRTARLDGVSRPVDGSSASLARVAARLVWRASARRSCSSWAVPPEPRRHSP